MRCTQLEHCQKHYRCRDQGGIRRLTDEEMERNEWGEEPEDEADASKLYTCAHCTAHLDNWVRRNDVIAHAQDESVFLSHISLLVS
jgi:hypothetical protein